MGSRISLFMMGKALAAPAPNQPAGIPVVVFIVSIIVILMIAAFAAYFLANYFSRSMNEKFIKEQQQDAENIILVSREKAQLIESDAKDNAIKILKEAENEMHPFYPHRTLRISPLTLPLP